MTFHRDTDGACYNLTPMPNVAYRNKIDLLEMECLSLAIGHNNNLSVSPDNSKGRIKTVYFHTAGDSLLLGSHRKGWAYTNLAGTRIMADGFKSQDEAEKAAYLAGYEIMRLDIF
jgi:hypothetical protein